jgi:hypothetical protein
VYEAGIQLREGGGVSKNTKKHQTTKKQKIKKKRGGSNLLSGISQ